MDVRDEMVSLSASIEDVNLSIKKQKLDQQSFQLKLDRLVARHPDVAKELGLAPEPEETTEGGEKRGPGRPKKADAAAPAAAPATAPVAKK